MNDNTILRIKVPAHLYESVKKQLTLTEAKKGGKTYGDWTVVKEKKAPKDGMKKVVEGLRDGMYNDFAKWKESFPEDTEFKEENGYMMAKDKEGKELGKWNPSSMLGSHADDFQYKSLEETPAKKDRSLEELMKAKKHLEKKINEMEASKDKIKEGDVSESVMSSVIDAMQGNPQEFIQSLKLALDMSTNEFQNFLAGLGTLGTVGALATNAAIKDKKANQKADQEAGSMEEAKEEKKEEDK